MGEEEKQSQPEKKKRGNIENFFDDQDNKFSAVRRMTFFKRGSYVPRLEKYKENKGKDIKDIGNGLNSGKGLDEYSGGTDREMIMDDNDMNNDANNNNNNDNDDEMKILIYGNQRLVLPKTAKNMLQRKLSPMQKDIALFYKFFPNGLREYYLQISKNCTKQQDAILKELMRVVSKNEFSSLYTKDIYYHYAACHFEQSKWNITNPRDGYILHQCLTKSKNEISLCSSIFNRMIDRYEVLLSNIGKLEVETVQQTLEAKTKCNKVFKTYTLLNTLLKSLELNYNNNNSSNLAKYLALRDSLKKECDNCVSEVMCKPQLERYLSPQSTKVDHQNLKKQLDDCLEESMAMIKNIFITNNSDERNLEKNLKE